MKIFFLLYVYFMVLGCQGIVPVPAPVNVKVLSNNFNHILQWSLGEGTQLGTVYNVKIGVNQELDISGTSLDISKYMIDIFRGYEIQFWASFGNRSSSKVSIMFWPYEMTTIGPPMLSLSGCGDCLNISIDLPNRQDDPFYNTINFDMYWAKVDKGRDEEEICHTILNRSQIKRSVTYSYVLHHLEPGQQYCVYVKPTSSSISNSLGSCSCEFTRQIQSRGVTFLACWVVGSMLVGLCFLSFIFILVYTGFLCKRNLKFPKALIVPVHGYFFSPEQMCISVAEIEYGVQIHKLKDHHQEKKEKGNYLYKNSDTEDEDDFDDDKVSHHGYMDRSVPSETESTSSMRSASICEVAKNSGECSIEDTPMDSKENLLSLAQHQHDGVKGYDNAASLDSVMTNSNTSKVKEEKILGGQMKEEEKDKEEFEEEHSVNVNLWSVVLKSMQPEEDEADELRETSLPLLPLLQDLQEKSLIASVPQTEHSSLYHTRTESLTSLENETISYDTNVCDHVRTGYMASHTGTLDTENYSSEDEEEDCNSGYMTR